MDYQEDGHSHTMWKEYVRSPHGFVFWRKTCMKYPQSTKRLVIDCIHYVAECKLAGEKHFIRESPRKLLTVLCAPIGMALEKKIRAKVEMK